MGCGRLAEGASTTRVGSWAPRCERTGHSRRVLREFYPTTARLSRPAVPRHDLPTLVACTKELSSPAASVRTAIDRSPSALESTHMSVDGGAMPWGFALASERGALRPSPGGPGSASAATVGRGRGPAHRFTGLLGPEQDPVGRLCCRSLLSASERATTRHSEAAVHLGPQRRCEGGHGGMVVRTALSDTRQPARRPERCGQERRGRRPEHVSGERSRRTGRMLQADRVSGFSLRSRSNLTRERAWVCPSRERRIEHALCRARQDPLDGGLSDQDGFRSSRPRP